MSLVAAAVLAAGLFEDPARCNMLILLLGAGVASPVPSATPCGPPERGAWYSLLALHGYDRSHYPPRIWVEGSGPHRIRVAVIGSGGLLAESFFTLAEATKMPYGDTFTLQEVYRPPGPNSLVVQDPSLCVFLDRGDSDAGLSPGALHGKTLIREAESRLSLLWRRPNGERVVEIWQVMTNGAPAPASSEPE